MAATTFSKTMYELAMTTEFFQTQATITKNIVVLLLGKTGAGKSAFINLLGNWICFGNDISKYKNLIPEPTYTGGDGVSKTIRPYAIRFKCVFGGKEYTITLLDTPGFADTRGLEQDKQNVQMLADILADYPYVTAIFYLITKENIDRSDKTRLYVEAELKAMFGGKTEFCQITTRTLDSSAVNPMDNQIDLLLEGKISHDVFKTLTLGLSQPTLMTVLTKMQTIETVGIEAILTNYKLRVKMVEESDLLIQLVKCLELNQHTFKTRPVEEQSVHSTLCIECLENCHSPCHLSFQGSFGIFLRECACMTSEACHVCGCSYRYHRHFFSKYSGAITRKDIEEVVGLPPTHPDFSSRALALKTDSKIKFLKLMDDFQHTCKFGYDLYLQAYYDIAKEVNERIASPLMSDIMTHIQTLARQLNLKTFKP